jgi:DNA-directed RNA polymerase subunit RPC12/RpoP
MNCPNCGQEIPEEVGQHAVVPSADIVDCPNCGARVSLETGKLDAGVSPEGDAEDQGGAPIPERAPESFAGETTVEGVMEEIDEKEQS